MDVSLSEHNMNEQSIRERVKELGCIFAVVKLGENNSIDQKRYFDEIVEIIPAGFQDPSNTSVHIRFSNRSYRSKNFRETKNFLEHTIVFTDQSVLDFRVYSDEKIPFLPEEVNLTDVLRSCIEQFITRRLSESAIIRELKKFQIITDQANYGTAIATTDGVLTYVNDAFAQMHGWEKADLIGQNLLVLHNEEQLKQVLPLVEKIRSEGGFSAVEVNHCKKDGTVFPTLMTAKLVETIENDEAYLSATVIDITENKLIEKRILKQKRRLRATIEAMPDMIFITSKDGTYLEFIRSRSNPNISDYSFLVGQNISDAFPSEIAELHLRNIKRCLETREIITYEYPRVEDGIKKYFEGRVVYLEDDRVLRLVREITETKYKENELKKLTLAIEQSPVALVITDLEAKIVYASPAFFKTTGYLPDEVIGMHTRMLKSGKTSPEVYKDLWSTITNGNTWTGEWINKTKFGEYYWENVSITPITDESGQVVNYLAIKEDISKNKLAEIEIRELNANLEKKIEDRTHELEVSNLQLLNARFEADQANNAKSEFLSRMSHELRTPLNSILGFAQLLEMGALDPVQQKNVSHILRGGRHLLDLINEILDISRIEAGRISISLEPVEINGLINELLDSISPFARKKNIQIEFNHKPPATLYVRADRQRLKQVLLNLMNNAVKYNRDDGKVLIQTDRNKSNNNENELIRISVFDNGPGISSENLEKLFIPFERIGADHTDVEGTGLGLTVVKKLTELMSGHVGVDSEEGMGSCFWVELPLASSELDRVLVNGDISTSTVKPIQHQTTILYVEDNISNIDLVEQILSSTRPGIKLMTTIYGKQALKMATEYHVDLILLDLNLPDIHGSEVLEMLQQNPQTKSIPVVIISADAMPKQMQNVITAGAKHYLTKPLEVSSFLNAIDQYLVKKH
jgi:PAS domain S-box-containing protein